jgi:hypothetical protein
MDASQSPPGDCGPSNPLLIMNEAWISVNAKMQAQKANKLPGHQAQGRFPSHFSLGLRASIGVHRQLAALRSRWRDWQFEEKQSPCSP